MRVQRSLRDRGYARLFGLLVLALVGSGCGYQPAPVAPPPGSPNAAAPSQPTAAPAAGAAPVSPIAAAVPTGPLPAMLWDAEPATPAWAGGRKDEPFDVKQFLESRAAPADNAAPLYFAALAELSGNMYPLQLPPGAAWPWRAPVPPQVKTLSDSIDGFSDTRRMWSGVFPVADLERVLAAAQPALSKLDAAQQNSRCVFVTGLGIDAMAPHAQASRTVARLAVMRMYRARVTGDFAAVGLAVRQTLRLSRDLRPRGMHVVQLVSAVFDGMVFTAISDLMRAQRGLTVEHCDGLLALLAEHEARGIPSTEEGIRMEYIIARNEIEAVRAGRHPLGDPSSPFAPSPQGKPKPDLDWEEEVAACNRVFARLLTMAAQPSHEILANQLVAKARLALRGETAVLVRTLAPALDTAFDVTSRRQAQWAAAVCLVAIRRYQLAHGSFPADLDTAAREAGVAVPMDPYSGQAMHYRLADGRPLVYSVGPDQKDDGGRIEWNLSPNGPGDYVFRLEP